jgi:glycine/D-amino acid oxidase-like deaminating enzyme
MIPGSARFVVVGAGVHGLSTAVHLAESLGSGEDVVVVEKSRVGGGASGVSGGIVRNFYLSAAMNELVRRSVEIFELDPGLFGFRQAGYVAVVPAAQAGELERIAAQHAAVGYASRLVTGVPAVRRHMRALFPDWRARGLTAALHESRSGWADAATTLAALAGMTRAAGVQIAEEVEVVGFRTEGGAVTAVETEVGPIRCDTVVLAPGPWARHLWGLLELPLEIEVAGATEPLFHFWQVREGEYAHDRSSLEPSSPVVHLDADERISEHLPTPWGIYFRPGLGGGIAAGGLPLPLEPDCPLDPYGPSHPVAGLTTPRFDRDTQDALTWALGRFDGGAWSSSSYACPTLFTPDSYPIAGFVRENVYALLDSNHGFKMLALGQLAARELTGGEATELDSFRLERFAAADLHPVSASPYPWT